MKIRPLHDRVIVKRVEDEMISRGGIIIPDTAKEKPVKGRVVAAGPGRRLDNGDIRGLTVSEGDLVLFTKYGGTEVKLNGEEHLILREDDILGILS